MARAVELQTLILRVQRACDIENATTRFPTDELTDYINESLAELYDLIRASFGQDYYRQTYTFQVGNNTASYPLPVNFLSIISVDVPLGGNLVLTCKPYMENERNLYKFFPFGAWTMHQPIYYRLTGAQDSTGGSGSAQTITFMPTPTGAYTVNVNYTPTPIALVNPTDTFDGVAGWEQYAILDAASKVAMKDENYDLLAVLDNRKAQMMGRIEKMAAEHDAGQPERVHDVVKDYETFDW